MLAAAVAILAVGLTIVAVSCSWLHWRARQVRRILGEQLAALGQQQHDRSLALDRRCDYLQEMLQRLTEALLRVSERQRIHRLLRLLSHGEHDGRLDPERRRVLERFVLDLATESETLEAACIAVRGPS